VKSDQGKITAAAGLLEELRSKGDKNFRQTIDDMVSQVSPAASADPTQPLNKCKH
jgi:hypothetical protein